MTACSVILQMQSNMKNIVKAFAVLAGIAALAACNKYAEYNWTSYASFDTRSYNVLENVGTLEVNLNTYNISGPCTVTFSTSGTAVAGENYRIVGNESGVINFSQAGTQTLQIEIINHPYDINGALTLDLTINSVTDGVEIGALNTVHITIRDYVVVDWTYLASVWNAQDYDNGSQSGGAYKVAFTKVSDNQIALTNLWDGGETIMGTVEFDEKANTAAISFPARQVVMDASAYGYGALLLIGQNDAGSWAWAPVKATVSASGVEIGPWNLVITEGEYAGYLYGDSYSTVLTK